MSTRKLRRRPNDPPPQADSKKRKTNGDILSFTFAYKFYEIPDAKHPLSAAIIIYL